MKKKILILGLSSILLCGCGKIPKLTNGDEAVVTFKDEAKISANDFYKEIKDSYGLQTLVNMVDKYIYEKEFSDKLSNAKAYAEASVSQFKTNFEDEETALQALQYYYRYSTFDAFENAQYLSYLQNEAIEAYVEDQVTEDELKKYYETDVYPNMTISHILVTPDVKDGATDDEKTEAENKAKETIKNIISELNTAKKNSEDIENKFGELASTYSEDAASKNNKGSLGEINIGSLNSSYDELVKAASKLNDGEYSTEVITTELGYHVILKTSTGEKKSYEDSLSSMKSAIAKTKLNGSSAQELSVDAIRYYRDKYDLEIVDSEIDKQYSRYMNNLINQSKSSSK